MTKRTTSDEASLVPARGLPDLDGPEMREWAAELVDQARSQGVDLTGEGGLLTAMVRQVLQTGLEVELKDHLRYEPYDPAGRGSGNSRNGSTPKTVSTEIGDVELRVPRDRNGTFEPVTVPKHARRLDGLAANVVSLYAKGMTTGDIQTHLAEIYDTEISRETISKITDFERLYPRRNDAESINRALDDSLWLRRAHSQGHARQQLNLLGYALMVNGLALHRHRRRQPTTLAA